IPVWASPYPPSWGEWEAIGMIAGIPGGRALARHHWDAYLKTGPPGAGPATALKEVAAASPRQARDLLRIWLKGRHIDADLELNDQRWVTEIPGPLSIEGDLWANLNAEAMTNIGVSGEPPQIELSFFANDFDVVSEHAHSNGKHVIWQRWP
ncbi:MAG: hypothetical protein KGL39_53930, partial [Patescibacteria group bacterium]|nr:hypothetical protein [Patescibacteria group bacterium]